MLMNQIESTPFLVLLSNRRVASLSSKSQHAKNKTKRHLKGFSTRINNSFIHLPQQQQKQKNYSNTHHTHRHTRLQLNLK